MIGSVALFVVFATLGIAWTLTRNPDLKYVIFVPLIAALLALPRDLSDAVVGPELKSRYKLWLSFVRLAYFLVALFIMAILPSLLS